MQTSETVSVSCSQSSCGNAQDIEERISGLKILAVYAPTQSQRMRCFIEILQLRSEQLASEVRGPVPLPQSFGTPA